MPHLINAMAANNILHIHLKARVCVTPNSNAIRLSWGYAYRYYISLSTECCNVCMLDVDRLFGTASITVTSQWARWRPKSPALRLFTHTFIQAQIKENIKAPRHLTLCGEITGFPELMANKAENVSISSRHHDIQHFPDSALIINKRGKQIWYVWSVFVIYHKVIHITTLFLR